MGGRETGDSGYSHRLMWHVVCTGPSAEGAESGTRSAECEEAAGRGKQGGTEAEGHPQPILTDHTGCSAGRHMHTLLPITGGIWPLSRSTPFQRADSEAEHVSQRESLLATLLQLLNAASPPSHLCTAPFVQYKPGDLGLVPSLGTNGKGHPPTHLPPLTAPVGSADSENR